MTDELLIITPELSAGGVGDYTLRLLENWPKAEGVRLLVAQPPSSQSVSFPVAKLAATPAAIERQFPQAGGKILVQYSAYGFDPHGFPNKLIRALIAWKRAGGGRLVIMFHEIWSFWPVTNKNFFVQLWHRRAIRRLLARADEVFTSTQSQAEHLQGLSPRLRVRVQPVGSNIRRREPSSSARNPGWAVLFGRQATRLRALKEMHGSIHSLAKAGIVTKVIAVGAGEDPAEREKERALLAALPLTGGFEQLGQRSEEEISGLLLSAAFGIFAQNELSLTKSGTFMAYAAHGLNVLADFASDKKPAPISWLVAPAELLRGLPGTELSARADELRAWQERVSSWKIISGNLAAALDLEPANLTRAGGRDS